MEEKKRTIEEKTNIGENRPVGEFGIEVMHADAEINTDESRPAGEATPQVAVNALAAKVIYVYRHLDVKSHEGWLKVGETSKSRITGEGRNRRIQEQNTAANVAYEVLYTTDAVRNNGTVFSDKDIHDLLVAKDIEREDTINPETSKKSEWFKTDLETVIETIEDYKMHAVRDEHDVVVDYALRDEQKQAIAETADYWEVCQEDANKEPAFLWNAKPRFGKTLTAYNFAANIGARKVLIVTNRPAVADSWYKDFQKFDFCDRDQEDGKFHWLFTASEPVRERLGNPSEIFTRGQQIQNPHLTAKNTIHFISLQDIKGKVKNDDGIETFKQKNGWVFDWDWDLVIIDESHEGVDTSKAFRVFDSLKTGFTLHLSGTPFKAIATQKFSSDRIFNWSYPDEQKAKVEWSLSDGQNPYAELPKMHIFTFQLSKILETTAEEAKQGDGEYAFDLAEFFRVVREDGEDHFAYEDKVRLFVRNLSNPAYQYPFSTAAWRESLRHTFWLLPSVKACQQMKKLLLEDEYFRQHYTSEDIVMAAGEGDDDRKAVSALLEVRKRIGEEGSDKHPLETRTITLSCGQLTTGVTVPAWTAVLMLNNCKSPAQYMQSAFRAQNPWSISTAGGECFIKENCYVFDFAPDRILQTIAEIADSGVSDSPSRTREEKIKLLINFLPVIAEDREGKMKYLDANEVLTIPLRLVTEEVVNRGFMSNRLFKNISNIFGCPQEIRDILAKMDEGKAGRKVERDPAKKSRLTGKPRVWEDKDKKIHVGEDIVVNTTNGLLGEKKYVELNSDEGREVNEIVGEVKRQAEEHKYSPATVKELVKAVAKRLPKVVSKLPDSEPEPGDPDYFEKEQSDTKPSREEKTEEEKTRDRLRGFARTIPSFLMAYGTPDTTLANFDEDVPAEVFEELTNITKEDFRKLRDGGIFEVKNEQGEIEEREFDGFIDDTVFNASVQAFMEKRRELACYWSPSSDEDIFEYIPPQENNQIFTPKAVVRKMVDMVEAVAPELFASSETTFIDPYMKSGMYITEIVRRVFKHTRERFESDTACVRHILEHQVFGLAPTPILAAITKNYIFGFDPELVLDHEHFRKFDAVPAAKDGTLPMQLNQIFSKGGENMKFDVVIGNPPYNENVPGNKSSRSIYPDFVRGAFTIGGKVSLVMPARWMSGEEGPFKETRGFIETMTEGNHLVKFVLYPNSRGVFSGVDVKGGICYWLWDKKHHDEKVEYKLIDDGEEFSSEAVFSKYNNIIIRFPQLITIVDKIFTESVPRDSMKTLVSSRNPFGFVSNLFTDNNEGVSRISEEKEKDDDYLVYGLIKNKRCRRYIPNFELRKNIEGALAWKVFLPRANGSGVFGEVFSTPMIGTPMTICTDTFLQVGQFDDKTQAESLLKYVKTKFFRALVGVKKTAIFNYKDCFEFVPRLDFKHEKGIDWSKSVSEIDRQLYRKYNLSPDEIAFIETKVKPMD